MITLDIVSSGGTEEAVCLVGLKSIVYLERERPVSSYLDDEHLRYMTLLALTIGQEDVADLFYVTKAYHGD